MLSIETALFASSETPPLETQGPTASTWPVWGLTLDGQCTRRPQVTPGL